MTNQLLAIADAPETDGMLICELAAREAGNITVLIETADADLRRAWADGDVAEQTRERLARLITAIEVATGAVVVGAVTAPAAVARDKYDAVVHPVPEHAFAVAA
jgi:hypothetical protein